MKKDLIFFYIKKEHNNSNQKLTGDRSIWLSQQLQIPVSSFLLESLCTFWILKVFDF